MAAGATTRRSVAMCARALYGRLLRRPERSGGNVGQAVSELAARLVRIGASIKAGSRRSPDPNPSRSRLVGIPDHPSLRGVRSRKGGGWNGSGRLALESEHWF